MGTVEIVCADVLEWAETYTGEPFHAMLCDPPYELNFMSKGWDNTGIAFQPSTWTALAAHLLPGAWLMAFASSRGWHRLAVAIEDAGMVIQPSIFGWGGRVVEVPGLWGFCTGQSFPKATNISKQIDKNNGRLAERIKVGEGSHAPTNLHYAGDVEQRYELGKGENGNRIPITESVSPLARAWEGHRYGGQVLKNALEPIICAQKPWEGKRLECIVETGTGALWVDGGRVNYESGQDKRASGRSGDYGQSKPSMFLGDSQVMHGKQNSAGRWPPNFYLQHSPLCQARGTRRVKGAGWRDGDGAGEPLEKLYGGYEARQRQGYTDADGLESVQRFACEIQCQDCGHMWVAEERGPCVECEGDGEWVCAVRKLGEQSGDTSRSQVRHEAYDKPLLSGETDFKRGMDKTILNDYGDRGTAARFFPNPDWSLEVAETLAGADPVRYCAKSSRAERDAGLDDMEPIEALYRGNLVCKACGHQKQSGSPCQCEEPDWDYKPLKPQRCTHPTVKPLSLNKWLATLLLPPLEYAPRRLLVPFAGVFSEAIGALLAGWEHITVIEMSQEYCDIGRARVKFWQGWSERTGLTEPKAILKAHKKAVKKAAKAPAPQQVALQL